MRCQELISSPSTFGHKTGGEPYLVQLRTGTFGGAGMRERQSVPVPVPVPVRRWGDASNDEKYDAALERSLLYLDEHALKAAAIGKPLLVSEFGLARDAQSMQLDGGAGTHRRNAFYAAMFRRSFELRVSGVLPWAWGGEGRPREVGCYWLDGDDLIGDPPHEHQGWYSVFDTDTATLDVFRLAERLLSGGTMPMDVLDANAHQPVTDAGGSVVTSEGHADPAAVPDTAGALDERAEWDEWVAMNVNLSLVSTLNARMAHARMGNVIAAAGVLLRDIPPGRIVDGSTKHGFKGEAWMPCAEGPCSGIADRFSAHLVHPGHMDMPGSIGCE